MIRSIGDKDTEVVWNRQFVRRFGADVVKMGHRKMLIIDAASNLNDLRAPPGNRLEKLSGDREGQHSIRVNDQWRICFEWVGNDAERVELTDYHREEKAMPSTFPPVHPGEVLLHEFMEPLGLSQNKLANAIDVPPRRINQIVHGRRAITADTALRLSKALGLSDMFWINMQSRYDAEVARLRLKENLRKIHRLPTDRIA